MGSIEWFALEEYKHVHPNVTKALVELDINATVETLKALLSDLKHRLSTKSKTGSSVQIAIKNLNDTVNKIQHQLDSIKVKIKQHPQSWWSYLYTYPDCEPEIQNLYSLKRIIDNRVELLTRAVTIELQSQSFRN